MSQKFELLMEGTYLYYQNDINYCQEDFKLVQLRDMPQFHIYSEISSRIETGEFLKVVVRYEMTNHYVPTLVRIEKSIGKKYVLETYIFDVNNQELIYVFQAAGMTQEFRKTHSSKHYLTAPSFATAAIFTLSKKMDATGRTPVTIVSATNEWSYTAPPTDKLIFAEYKSREMDDFRLNNTLLPASHLKLHEFDSSFAQSNEAPTDIYISKHYAIPYQLVQGTNQIKIQNLKRHT